MPPQTQACCSQCSQFAVFSCFRFLRALPAFQVYSSCRLALCRLWRLQTSLGALRTSGLQLLPPGCLYFRLPPALWALSTLQAYSSRCWAYLLQSFGILRPLHEPPPLQLHSCCCVAFCSLRLLRPPRVRGGLVHFSSVVLADWHSAVFDCFRLLRVLLAPQVCSMA